MGHDNWFDIIHAILGSLQLGVGGILLYGIRKLETIEKDIAKIRTALKVGLNIDLP